VVTTIACGDDTASKPTSAPTTATPPADVQDVMSLVDFEALDPGTYSIDPDGDPATPLRATFEVPAGWQQWTGAVKFDDLGHVAVSIIDVTNLVRHGCDDHRPADPPVGPTVDDLADALNNLAPFEVTAAPRDVEMLGHRGTYLQWTVPEITVTGSSDHREFVGCVEGQLHSWIDAIGGESFYGYNEEPGRHEDFWILDVDSTRLVIAATWSPASPPASVAEMRAIIDSIRLQP
jgi:hypothetical protein